MRRTHDTDHGGVQRPHGARSMAGTFGAPLFLTTDGPALWHQLGQVVRRRGFCGSQTRDEESVPGSSGCSAGDPTTCSFGDVGSNYDNGTFRGSEGARPLSLLARAALHGVLQASALRRTRTFAGHRRHGDLFAARSPLLAGRAPLGLRSAECGHRLWLS